MTLYVGPSRVKTLLEGSQLTQMSGKGYSRVVSVLSWRGAASQGVGAGCVPQWAPTSNDEVDDMVPYLAVSRTVSVVIVARYGEAVHSWTFDFEEITEDITDIRRQVLSEDISHLKQLRHVRRRFKAGYCASQHSFALLYRGL